NLVSSVFLLRNGGKQIGERSQFLDTAYGLYHPGIQLMGNGSERMGGCQQKNIQHDINRNCRDRSIGGDRWIRQFPDLLKSCFTMDTKFKHVSYLWDENKAKALENDEIGLLLYR